MTRVLVIDDEPDVLLLCRVNLEHAGYEVIEAREGAQGLALAQSERPDAVILDLMIPIMGGYEVLAAMRADEATHDVPVLILTAKAQRDDRIRCWEDGAAEFVTKPFPPDLLLDALARVMAMSEAERQARREEALHALRSES
jgi:DNA-binding response OmpR family regulator